MPRRILCSWPIRRKLLLLLILIIFPVSGVIVQSGLEERSRQIAAASNKALLVAQSLAAQQEQVANGIRQMLSTLALLPEVQRQDGEACSRLFKDLHDRNPIYSTIVAVKPDGAIFASSQPIQGTIDLSDRKHIRDALRTLDFSAGEYIVGRVSKVESLNFTYPVLTPDGKLVALVVAGFRLNEYARFIAEAGLPEGFSISIVDHKGMRLYRLPLHSEAASGRPVPDVSFEQMTGARDEGIYEYQGADGIERIYAYKQIRLRDDASPYLYMVAGIAKEQMLTRANQKMLHDLFFLSIATFLAIALMWYLEDLALARPVRQLVDATQKFGKGDMRTRTGLQHTADELGQLARSFDDMASLLEMRDRERRQAEEDLQTAWEKLEVKVAERTEELARANQSLQSEILERRQAELRLRKSEEQYRVFVETASEGMWAVNADHHITFVNQVIHEKLGYSMEEMIGRPVSDFVVEEELEDHLLKLESRIQGVSQKFERKLRRRNGEPLWVIVSATSLLNEEGVYQGSFSMLTDISDRKQAEEALQEREEIFRAFMEFSPIYVFIKDEQIRPIRLSTNYEEMIGRPLEEIYGKTMDEIFPADLARSMIEDDLTVLRQGSPIEVVEELDGRVYKTTKFPIIKEGKSNLLGGFTMDITAQERMQAALREKELRYRTLFEAANDAIFLMEGPLCIECNLQAVSMLDVAGKEDIIGHHVVDFSPQKQPGGESSAKKADQLMKACYEGISQSFYWQFQSKTGNLIDAEVSLTILNINGKTFIQSVVRDVSESMRAAEDRKKMEVQLVQVQKLEAIGRLAGGVAHDYNNMLGVILGYVDLLKTELPADAPVLKRILEIEKAGLRSRDITRQLLAFSRKQIALPRVVDLNSLIENMQKTLARLIGEDVELHFTPGQWPCRVAIDPSQVDQILVNLAINARDAMPLGGKLAMETKNITVDEAYCGEHIDFRPGGYVQLTVSDEGIGMSKEVLSHIFEPFFTTKEPGKGTGLGLSTVYGIVKQNGGFILARSEPEEGSTFNIYLPQTTAGAEEDGMSAEDGLPTGAGTILLVEDDDMVREMVRGMLKAIGYTAYEAASSQEALEFLEKSSVRIDLLLTDVIMPGMGGKELAEKVKANNSGIRVLFMSGYASNVIVHHGVLDEGVNYIQKPFSMEDLARKLGTLMGKKADPA